MQRRRNLAAALAATAGLAVACGGQEESPRAAPTPPPASAPAAPPGAQPAAPAPPAAPAADAAAGAASAAAREAAQIFALRCATCHGPDGRGDGPGSVALEPKPRNYHDAAWQASISDAHLAQIIVEGGPAVGRSPLMPPNPDLATKPEVVAALVAHIRSLAKP